jgi:preprotein translocase subunit SecG
MVRWWTGIPLPRHPATSLPSQATRPASALYTFYPRHPHGRAVRCGPLEFAVSVLAVSFWSYTLNTIIVLLGLLMILTILIQRGKGGGLIGAFGGAGGSSPFGSKAGDTFTRITITMAAIWVILIMIHVKVAKKDAYDYQHQSSVAPRE